MIEWLTTNWLALLIVATVITGLFLAWRTWLETYHFVAVEPGVLYRDGNRGMREFSTACRRSGARTIVMLADEKEVHKPPFPQEIQFCEQRRLNLVRVPVDLGGWPSSADVQKFLDVATDPANQPVLVHCAQGVQRTGMMVAAYQMSILGYDKPRARREMLAFGHSRRTTGAIEDFIEAYDPDTRTVGPRPPRAQTKPART